MTPFNPAPKPPPRPPKPVKWLRNTTPLPRSTKPIARSALKSSRRPIPQRNERRRRRRLRKYSAHLRSAYWKKLRREAYLRDGGLCQCRRCIAYRLERPDDYEATRIPIWFDKKGGIHGFDTHHTTYIRFGAEWLEDVLTMIPAHHRWQERVDKTRVTFFKSPEGAQWAA